MRSHVLSQLLPTDLVDYILTLQQTAAALVIQHHTRCFLRERRFLYCLQEAFPHTKIRVVGIRKAGLEKRL